MKTEIQSGIERLIQLHEVAARLSVSIRTVFRLIADKTLPHPVKVGRSSRLYSSDVDEYLERLRDKRGEG
jgi:excisionase family DNA binding protein